MIFILKNSKQFVSLLVLCCVTAACNPTSNGASNSGGGANVSALSKPELTAVCEAQLRQQFLKKSLKLQSIDQISSEIAQMNGLVAITDHEEYGASQTQGQTTSLSVTHFKVDPTQKTRASIEYDLTSAGATSNFALILTIKVESIQSDQDVSITQQYNVDQSCQATLSQTLLDELDQTAAQDFVHKKNSFYLDANNDQATDKFTLPANANFLNFSLQGNDVAAMPPHGYSYINGVGVVEIDIKPLAATQLNAFGVLLSLDNLAAEIRQNSQLLLTINYSQDLNRKMSFSETLNNKTWVLPLNIWNSLSTTVSPDAGNVIRSNLPKDYFVQHNSFLLTTSKIPTYDHFAAYWNTLSSKQDATSQMYALSLSENSEASIAAGDSAADLESNSTIETRLPAIQKIAQSILAQSPNDRAAQIELILAYLKNNYTYDYSMVNNNIVRPLSTEEALSAGKGVCQHYAVIFASVARALKIPTRIVEGFYLGEQTPGGHAWNEAEVAPGLWKVIEPQNPDSLRQIYTRFYLPVSRAYELENKDSAYTPIFLIYASMNYTLQASP